MASAQNATEVEPNDAAGQAQRIVPGQSLDACLSTTADTDWFAFTLAVPQQVNLRAIAANTALPQPPKTSQNVPNTSAPKRFISGISTSRPSPAADYIKIPRPS